MRYSAFQYGIISSVRPLMDGGDKSMLILTIPKDGSGLYYSRDTLGIMN